MLELPVRWKKLQYTKIRLKQKGVTDGPECDQFVLSSRGISLKNNRAAKTFWGSFYKKEQKGISYTKSVF